MSEYPLDDFEFSIPLTRENAAYLEYKGYEKRNGSFAYAQERTILVVVPFKKWYWEDTGKGRSVHLTIEEEVIVKKKLVINKN